MVSFAEARIDDQNRLLELTTHARGRMGGGRGIRIRWSNTTHIRFFDWGTPVTIEPPAEPDVAEMLPQPFGASVIAYPFHARLSRAFSGLDRILSFAFGGSG